MSPCRTFDEQCQSCYRWVRPGHVYCPRCVEEICALRLRRERIEREPEETHLWATLASHLLFLLCAGALFWLCAAL